MMKIVAALMLVWGTLAVLQVYSPACWADKLPSSIQYTLSNFGEIPYGETLIGQISLPSDPELCSTTNEAQLKSKDSSIRNVLLVKRGTCKFTQKVINAQNLGADVIIIYDNNNSDAPSVIMKNDGHGHLAEIPSLFISHTDGLKLLTGGDNCKGLPVVRMMFEIDQLEESQVTLWLDAGNRETYVLARDFYKNSYYEAIRTRVSLQVRFRVENNCEDWICSKDDCVGTLTEKYCRNIPKPDDPSIPYTKGSDLIREQLREYFLWEQLRSSDPTVWWKYMTKFDHNICLQQKDVEDCSYASMEEVGLSSNTIQKVKQGVKDTLDAVGERKPNVLRTSFEESREMGIYFYPEATINSRNFYGLFKAPEVFEAICNSLLNPPTQCIQFIKQNHEVISNEEGGVAGRVFLILGLMTLGFLVALWVYTRLIKKEVNQQLSVEVNRMVEKYVIKSDKKGDSSGSSYNKFQQ